MHWLVESPACLVCIGLTFTAVFADPQVAFPINSQVPPVAYVSKEYQYSFSPTTFRTTAPPIAYQIDDAPTWLSLDSASRTFSGTPTEDDIGAVTFQLIAKDDEGETTLSVTLVVLADQEIQLGQSITSYLEVSGPISAPAALLLHPDEGFQVALSPDIFIGISPETTYYAILADNTPLPPWLQFDPATLIVSGTAPPLVSTIAIQQIYKFHLVATNVLGFSEASVSFQIAVSPHVLAFTKATDAITITPEQTFQSEAYRGRLQLDGRQSSSEEIASITAKLPDWLQLDSEQIQLSGDPPRDLNTTEIVIVASDIYSNTANLSITLNATFTANLETDHIQILYAFIGQDFTYIFNSSELDTEPDSIDVNFGDISDWLVFNQANLTIHGHVPDTTTPRVARIFLTAKEKDLVETFQFDLQIVYRSRTNVTVSTGNTVTSTAQTSTESAVSDGKGTVSLGNKLSRRLILAIVLAVLFPVLVAVGCIAFILARNRRRSKKLRDRNYQDKNTETIANNNDIAERTQSMEAPVRDPVSEVQQTRDSPYGQPPRIDLFWMPKSQRKLMKKTSLRARQNNDESLASSWEDLVRSFNFVSDTVKTPVRRRSQSEGMARPIDLPPPAHCRSTSKHEVFERAQSQPFSDHDKRLSRVLSTMTNSSRGLPHRLSGVGHGTALLNSSHIGFRSSWQTTMGSISAVEVKKDLVALDPFALSPKSEIGSAMSRPDSFAPNFRPTIRLVGSSSGQSESFESKLQQWHTERAKNNLEGIAQPSYTGYSKATSILKQIPSNTRSTTILEGHETDSDTSHHSFSKWSTVGPAIATEESDTITTIPISSFHQKSHQLKRNHSIASSGQFDSALSSDSQWEDENLIAEENESGLKRWHTDVGRGTPSPRLPFEMYSTSQEEIQSNSQAGVSRRARLTDQRRCVSVEKGDLSLTQKSNRGSFRFI